jgi:RNA polymerase sigma-70 factor, ECF subfamily
MQRQQIDRFVTAVCRRAHIMYPDDLALTGHENERTATERSAGLDNAGSRIASSFAEVFERHHSMVFHLVYRILGDREEALDVSQEIFLTIYRKLSSFRGESSLKTWIYRIAINRASNRCRWWNRIRRRETVSLDEHLSKNNKFDHSDALEASGRSPEEALLLREEHEKIEISLQKLPLQQRVALIMRDIEGLAYEEIAEYLQVSLGTVKSRIARGREELKRRLNGTLG